ncbi:MAG: hypothetical protein ACK4MW_01450 [Aquificaceae bacterium]
MMPFVIIFILLLSACGIKTANSESSIKGKVEYWQAGYSLKSYIEANSLYFYGEIPVDDQGNFEYKLPTPKLEHLDRLSFKAGKGCNLEEMPILQPNNARAAKLKLIGSLKNAEVEIRLLNPKPSLGFDEPISGFFIYLDRDGVLNGYLKEACLDGTRKEIAFNNVRLSKGWNYIELYIRNYQGRFYSIEAIKKKAPSAQLIWM